MSKKDYIEGASAARTKLATALKECGIFVESSDPPRLPSNDDFIEAINIYLAKYGDLPLERSTLVSGMTFSEWMKKTRPDGES